MEYIGRKPQNVVTIDKFPLGLSLEESDNGYFIVTKMAKEYGGLKPGHEILALNGISLANIGLKVFEEELLKLKKDIKSATFNFRTPPEYINGELFSPFNHQGLDRECCIDQGTAMTGKGEIIADTITTIIQPMKTNYTHVVNTNDVITPNDLRKTIVNIDSRFRDDHVKQTDMNFTYRLNPQFKNVLRIKLASVEIPNIFYTFADNLGNTAFKVIANNMSAPVVITPGNYAVSDLQTIIQAKLNVATTMLGIPAPGLKITVDGQSGLVTFSSPVVFSIDFTPPSGTNFNASGLGWNLGFKNPMYFNALVFTGESCIDMFGEQYVLFQLNGYNNVEQRMKDKNFITAFAKIILRSSKFTVNYDDSSNFLTKEIIFPQPQNLSLLTVAFRDSYGNIINNNGVTISFALEITEVMNCKLYDYYRNYLIERTRF